MKATVLAESSYSIYFLRDLSVPVMSTDVSQVGVALFPRCMMENGCNSYDKVKYLKYLDYLLTNENSVQEGGET